MGRNIILRMECDAFKGNAVMSRLIIHAEAEGKSETVVLCLGCDVSLCRKHWMQFPSHAAFLKRHNIEIVQNEGSI